MAKHNNRPSSSKSPDPLNALVDLAGALALGTYAKSKVKRDYAKGEGAESVAAARAVFSAGALRGGSDGLISLGGLLGVNSAVKGLEREHTSRAIGSVEQDNSMDKNIQEGNDFSGEVSVYPVNNNDNRYAWRLNCEDGSAYNISSKDFETRAEYNKALQTAKETLKEPCSKMSATQCEAKNELPITDLRTYTLCRISRLDNGCNKYYLSEDSLELKIGDKVSLRDGLGIVLSVEHHTKITAPVDLTELEYIVGKILE